MRNDPAQKSLAEDSNLFNHRQAFRIRIVNRWGIYPSLLLQRGEYFLPSPDPAESGKGIFRSRKNCSAVRALANGGGVFRVETEPVRELGEERRLSIIELPGGNDRRSVKLGRMLGRFCRVSD